MSDAILRLYVAAKTVAVVDDERGASLVEYALLVALIALVSIAIITTLGIDIAAKFNQVVGGL